MIESVLVLNLERRYDKWMFALGGLRALDFDIGTERGVVERVLAHDGIAYESCEAVINAAVNDGFEYFDGYEWMSDRRAIAYCWSWASIMRRVIELNKTVMFILDDQLPMLGWNYWRLCKLINDADKHGEMRIIQLNASLTPNPNSEVVDPMLARGIGGPCDFGFILRSAGAQLFLNAQRIPIQDEGVPWDFPPVDLRRMCKGLLEMDCTTGIYHTLDPVVAPSQYKFESDLGND